MPSLEALRTIYDPPNAIVLKKVLTQFDRHTATFIAATRFAVLHARGADGGPVAILAGGPPGFIRVLNPTTLQIDMPIADWPSGRLPPPGNAAFALGLLFVVPGVKETMRAKGFAFVAAVPEDPARITITLELDNTFFHCAKAFIRSALWDGAAPNGRWKGLRKFRCIRKTQESAVITSFYFVPVDDGKLPGFQPGQHVTIELERPGAAAPVSRSYSLSNRPGEPAFRISVKREAPPALASGFLHDHFEVGDTVAMRAPAGRFVLDEASKRPVVLLSAGVGLTPMVSMLEHLVATGSDRRVWFFHGAISGVQHAMGAHVRSLARAHKHVGVHVCYGRPGPDDVLGLDYESEGRLGLDVLRRVLPWDDYDFYLCGPPAFMQGLADALTGAGIPSDRVRWESFTGATIQLGAPTPAITAAEAEGARVEFRRSGKTVVWPAGCRTLLELAEANGVATQFSCRSGDCFTCATRVLAGDVSYAADPETAPDAGTALICIAQAAGDLVLDL